MMEIRSAAMAGAMAEADGKVKEGVNNFGFSGLL
jgi:hypothetical protein